MGSEDMGLGANVQTEARIAASPRRSFWSEEKKALGFRV